MKAFCILLLRVFSPILLFIFHFLFMQHLDAATINTTSILALQTAINGASSGDTIILANGTYLNNTLTIGAGNITVKAATPGGVFLNGTNAITITGNNVTFSGFQFTSGSISGITITVEGNYCVLKQLNFNGYSAQKYINFKGQYDELSYSNFENKPTSAPMGNLIHINTRADGAPTYTWIHHNSFKNMPGPGGDNGNECIRITNANPSTYYAGCIIEYNYFNNTGQGDSEVISVKCEGNLIRYNTMENNNKGNFCFRYGNNNVAYGNFFKNSGGIRIKQSNNIYCYNNYFENCGDGSITAPFKFVYLSGYNNNCVIVHNTIVGGSPVEVDSGGSANTIANNIFKNTSGKIFSGKMSGISFSGNIYLGNLGVSIPSGMTNIDPQLIINSDGYFGISSTSPAINTSSANYPAIPDLAKADDDPNILLDISGQPRPTTPGHKDIGCDEYSTAGIFNRPLASSDVGPYYLGGPISGIKQNQIITFASLSIKSTGVADFSPGAIASSGLTVSYISSNTSVATIVNGMIHIVGAGSSVITAYQSGNATYNAAPAVSQTLTVIAPVVYDYSPSSVTILSGSLKTGNFSSLASNNSSYCVVNSTASGTRKLDWCGNVIISQAPSGVSKLTVRYDGKYLQATTQFLYLYNWSTMSWTQIDSRSVGTADVTVTSVQSAPSNFISTTGEIRLRVFSNGGTKSYSCSGDWMQFSVETSSLRLSDSGVSDPQILNSGVQEQNSEGVGFSIYPNPANDYIAIDYPRIKGEKVYLTIFNLNGKLIKELSFENQHEGRASENLPVLDLGEGIYVVRVTTGSQSKTIRLMVNR